MSLYSLIRPLLFSLPPEIAHQLTFLGLDCLQNMGLLSRYCQRQITVNTATKSLMGHHFANPLGIAAGLDKNADHLPALVSLGVGFVEVGTVTLRPQPGNPRPRLFRLPSEQALINRMGFNNKGVDHLVMRLCQFRQNGGRAIVGVNIGKNKDSDDAILDYQTCLQRVYEVADYVVVNISSPNTPGLRDWQNQSELMALLTALKDQQQKLTKKVPLVVKVAPDLDEAAIATLVTCLLQTEVEGVIATNTTIRRDGIAQITHAEETGGLSGLPLGQLADKVLQQVVQQAAGRLVVIASGGVSSPASALHKMRLGADLVQVYSGLIYQGPQLIWQTLNQLAKGAVLPA
jgi:dihydroorotate dehydrogenase